MATIRRNEKKFTQEEVIIGYVKVRKIMEDMHIEQIGVLENFQKSSGLSSMIIFYVNL